MKKHNDPVKTTGTKVIAPSVIPLKSRPTGIMNERIVKIEQIFFH